MPQMKGVLPLLRGALQKSENKKAPSWREMLELRPIRNPALEWSEEDERVILCIKHAENKGWKARVLKLFVPLPQERRVGLDAIGSDVWHWVDGKNTVGRIAKELAKKYKLEPREAQLSLQQYFKELGRRGYIGFTREGDE